MAEAEEDKKWWAKQRTWALVLGIAGTICTFIPAANVAAGPILAVAGLLGFKGLSDSQTRVENTAVKTERIAESNAAKLDAAAQ
jgi:hypothetical protein